MFKRIVSFLSAVIVMTSSVFAWDAYSFTGVYDVADLDSSFMVPYSGSSVSSVSSLQDWFSRFSLDSSSAYIGPYVTSTFGDSYPVVAGNSYTTRWPSPPDQATQLVSGTISTGEYIEVRSTPYYSITTDGGTDITNDSLSGIYTSSGSSSSGSDAHSWARLNFSLDGIDSFTAFSISGSFLYQVGYYINGVYGNFASGTSISIYVNGMLSRTWYSNSDNIVDFQDYIYSGALPVTDIYFLFSTGSSSVPIPDNGIDDFIVGLLFQQWDVTFDVISDTSILDGFNDQAQSDINEHESMESQWTGSMSSNFDALDMDSFTFPSGLLSGFSLITGIFQDLWNGMGDYKILYVFPLFLGIALLLIGRISKFSGGQSSSRSNRGDDDA